MVAVSLCRGRRGFVGDAPEQKMRLKAVGLSEAVDCVHERWPFSRASRFFSLRLRLDWEWGRTRRGEIDGRGQCGRRVQ